MGENEREPQISMHQKERQVRSRRGPATPHGVSSGASAGAPQGRLLGRRCHCLMAIAASDAAASGAAASNRAEKGQPRCCCCQLWRSYRRRRCRSSCCRCPCCSCRNRHHGCRNGRRSCFRRPAERPHTRDRNEVRTARGRVRRQEMDAMPGLEVACWWKQGQGLRTSHGLGRRIRKATSP